MNEERIIKSFLNVDSNDHSLSKDKQEDMFAAILKRISDPTNEHIS